MRRVVNSDQVAHLWANRVQDEARNAGDSMRFLGDTVYSYSTPIGRLVKDRAGDDVALFTEASYSMTTASKHLPAMRRAARHLPSFGVPALGAYGGRHRDPSGNMHEVNCLALIERYRAFVSHFKRMRSEPYEIAENCERTARTARDYAERFAIGRKARRELAKLNPSADANAISAVHSARVAKRAAPGYQEKLDRERDRREARRTEREIAERARKDAEYASALADWRAGTRHALPSYYRGQGSGPALRVVGDEVQSSYGARVPVAHARRALRFVCALLHAGALPWERPERIAETSYSVGGFRINRVTAEQVTIGCHDIARAEVEALAAQLGQSSAGERVAGEAMPRTAHDCMPGES